MTGTNRLTKKGNLGRPKKRFRKGDKRKHKSLGGIPMKINKKGNIVYAGIVPNNYQKKYDKHHGTYYEDSESKERGNATLPVGRGNFIRRHIYEIRFDIKDETEDERRKREYKEWWEKRRV